MNKIFKSKFFNVVLILLILQFPNSIFQFNLFSNSEYLGVKDNDIYIYSTHFDKTPLQEYFEDIGLSEEESEILVDFYFELMEFNSLTKQWKIEIFFVSSEKEMSYENRDLNYYTIHYKISKYHKANDDSTKRTIASSVSINIVEYSRKYYTDMFLDVYETFMLSTFEGRGFFIGKNVRWTSVLNELEKRVDNEIFDVKKITVNYFNDVGVKMIYQDLETYNDMSRLESIDKYNDNGVLYYKSLMYDNKYIAEFKLEIFNDVIYENWILLSLIISISIAGIIIYLIVKNKNE